MAYDEIALTRPSLLETVTNHSVDGAAERKQIVCRRKKCLRAHPQSTRVRFVEAEKSLREEIYGTGVV